MSKVFANGPWDWDSISGWAIAIEKGAFGSPSTKVANFLFLPSFVVSR